jgi:hypothetical protein
MVSDMGYGFADANPLVDELLCLAAIHDYIQPSAGRLLPGDAAELELADLQTEESPSLPKLIGPRLDAGRPSESAAI